MFKQTLAETVNFFKEREVYKITLRNAINKHGISVLPKAVQDSIPTDIKTLYEFPWYLQPLVLIRIPLIAYKNAENKAIMEALNVQTS